MLKHRILDPTMIGTLEFQQVLIQFALIKDKSTKGKEAADYIEMVNTRKRRTLRTFRSKRNGHFSRSRYI
jgi:hypothetical protein